MENVFERVCLVIAMCFVIQSVCAKDITLNDQCPPSFEKVNGLCEFRSLYQLYGDAQSMGGLRRALPKIRDGFSPQEIDLGRHLFFDPLLSGDGESSCASCHHPDQGFADGKARSRGFGGSGAGVERLGGVALSRAAPSLWNVGFAGKLFWDGRASTLEEQAEGPLFSADEMGNTPQKLQSDLNGSGSYRRLFAEVYPNTQEMGIDTGDVVRALTAFQSSLISLNSRYDRYAHGDQYALSETEKQGHNIFRSFVARCSQCHTPPLFTNNQIAAIGVPEPEGLAFDLGAGKLTADPLARGAFKVPTLRNIANTAPYMHSGTFKDLDEVVDFYNKKRGHALQKEQQGVHVHWHILHPDLEAQELKALVAFLQTLNDETMKPAVPERLPSGLPVAGFEYRHSNPLVVK